MDAAVGPDRRARFETIFAEAYEPLQRYVRRRAAASDVDDVVAEALTVLWRRCDEVPVDMAVPYAYGVARRCLANQRRGDERRRKLLDRLGRAPGSETTTSRTPAPDDVAAGDPALAAALAALADDDREMLRLWAWEQLAPREIAVTLGITANAASLRLHRARTRCAELLGERSGPVASLSPETDAAVGQDRRAGGHSSGGSDTEVTS